MISTATSKIKFKKLVRGLGESLPEKLPVDVETITIGVLERLWHVTADEAPRGDIGKFSNDLIAEWIGWHGNADSLIRSLVDCRWLDTSEEYRLIVHDWYENAPNYVKGYVKRHYGGFVLPD